MIFKIHCPSENCNGSVQVDTSKAVNKIISAKCDKCKKNVMLI